MAVKSTTYIERPYDIPITDPDFYKKSNRTNWHRIDIGEFTIDTPDEYLYTKLRGIDSKVGQISNGIETIVFMHGWYSSDLRELRNESTLTILERIDGRKFELIISKSRDGVAAAYTNDLKDGNSFHIVCYKPDDQDEIVEIFRRITFRD